MPSLALCLQAIERLNKFHTFTGAAEQATDRTTPQLPVYPMQVQGGNKRMPFPWKAAPAVDAAGGGSSFSRRSRCSLGSTRYELKLLQLSTFRAVRCEKWSSLRPFSSWLLSRFSSSRVSARGASSWTPAHSSSTEFHLPQVPKTVVGVTSE